MGAATAIDDVLADLVDEYDRLEAILSMLTTEQWAAPSAAQLPSIPSGAHPKCGS